jgi:type VII secretion protein EccB
VATRRDQLQSYQFLTQRVISAFVMRETDPAQSPLRRGVGAAFAGVMIAVIVGAVFGIIGVLAGTGTDAWRQDGSVVVEKETGAAYVYADGALHPTLNYTSALLAAGRANPPVFRVSESSLDDVARGVTVGIAGAPASLPGADRQVGLPWTACSVPAADPDGQAVHRTTVLVATEPAGGRALGDEGLLVADAKLGTAYLVWHGLRYPIAQPRTTVPALFGATVATTPVTTAWLNTLPTGAPVGPPNVDGRGGDSAAVPGRKVGDLLVTQSATGPQYYLVFADGLAPISHLQQSLWAAQFPGAAKEISVQDASNAPHSRQLAAPAADVAPPAEVPTLANRGASDPVCATTRTAGTPPQLSVGATVTATTGTPTTGAGRAGTSLADRVFVPASRVALVRVASDAAATTGPYFVVTDLGIRYPVPDAGVLALLGYAPSQAVNVPASLMSRLPTGPALDPTAALTPAVTTN